MAIRDFALGAGKLFCRALLTLQFAVAARAAAPDFTSAASFGGTGSDRCLAAATDQKGNLYITGSFDSPSLAFGPLTLVNNGALPQLFLAKLDPSGKPLWARTSTGTGNYNVTPRSLAVDAAGDVYVTGAFTGEAVVFGFTALYPRLSSGAGYSGFVAKYSSAGDPLWARQIGSLVNPVVDGTRVEIDTAGLARVAGFFDPGSQSGGILYLENGFKLPAVGGTDSFLLTYSPNGTLLAARGAGGAGSDLTTGLALAPNGDSWTTGIFQRTATFGNLTLLGANTGNANVFLAKQTAAGDFRQAISVAAKGLVVNQAQQTPQLKSDYTGNQLFGACVLGGGSLVGAGGSSFAIPPANRSAIILAKYDANGVLLWGKILAEKPTGSPEATLTDMTVDWDDSVYVSGLFAGTVTFDGQTLTSGNGANNTFVAKIGPDGFLAWVKSESVSSAQKGYALARSTTGDVIVAGAFDTSTSFGAFNLQSKGGEDIFVARFPFEKNAVPRIAATPVSQSPGTGGGATFHVAARSPTPFSYQWFQNGKALPGQKGDTLTLSAVTADKSGVYYVEVTNAAGTVRSDPASLTVAGSPNIRVTTLSGSGVAGYANSADPAKAQFHNPDGLAAMGDGNIVVADSWNHAIRIVNPSGAADTFAGENAAGWVDGPGNAARFNYPIALFLGLDEDIFVADSENNAIRRIGKLGSREVGTVAGSGIRGLKNGPGLGAQFDFPNDIAMDTAENIFVTEYNNHTVRKIRRDGAVTTLAGTGQPGYKDGIGSVAQFNQPAGLAIDQNGNLFVTEWSNNRVRKITPDGVVSTWAGGGAPGLRDGNGAAALFHTPNGIASDHRGNLYVVEYSNSTVRRIDSQQNVTTVAGLGTPGLRNGDASTALFNAPGGIVVLPDGSLVVSDTLNHVLRKIEWLSDPPITAPSLVVNLNPSVTIYGQPGKQYRIEAAESDTQPLDWSAVATITMATNPTVWFDPQPAQPATKRKRFYRAVELP